MSNRNDGPDMIDMVLLIIDCDNYSDHLRDYNKKLDDKKALQEKIALMNKYNVNSY